MVASRGEFGGLRTRRPHAVTRRDQLTPLGPGPRRRVRLGGLGPFAFGSGLDGTTMLLDGPAQLLLAGSKFRLQAFQADPPALILVLIRDGPRPHGIEFATHALDAAGPLPHLRLCLNRIGGVACALVAPALALALAPVDLRLPRSDVALEPAQLVVEVRARMLEVRAA